MDPKGKAVVNTSENDAVETGRPPSPSQENWGPVSCYTKLLMENHLNFRESSLPVRFMYYEGGSWVEFAIEVVEPLQRGFEEGKAVIEVVIGGVRWLFDLYRMIQVDLRSGHRSLIAWTDVNGKSFFPKTCLHCEGRETGHVAGNRGVVVVNASGNLDVEILSVMAEEKSSPKPEIDIGIRIGVDSNKRKREVVKNECRQTEESPANVGSPRWPETRLMGVGELASPRWPETRLMGVGELAYAKVKDMFLSGMGIVEPGVRVTVIHQWVRSDPLGIGRNQVFLKQSEITKNARGVANMTLAWHGTSAEGVASILSHGFAVPNAGKFSGSESPGVGIYLFPLRSAHMSATVSEVDDYGEKHVVLCRVILGKSEQIEAGSQQMDPSSDNFDTGVDDLVNPKCYVVWFSKMNSHILPECIVSYKSSDRAEGLLREALFVKSVLDSALFAKLFSKLGPSLPSSRAQELRILCNTFKLGKLAKDSFMKQLRAIVGDEMLVSTIHELHGGK